jgi:hypothetical protein
MLLRWVLTRDRGAVLLMVEHYGGRLVDGKNVTRIRPQTWDDVLRNYCIDDSLPKEERGREALAKAKLFLIPAREEIYSSLRRGDIEGWARPNGSGDIVKIEPIQWAGLRFRAHDGHDIAVPVDSEKDPLPLPRPIADYLSGSVPAANMPTVWPDPLFPAGQAMRLWQPRADASAEETTTTADPMPRDAAVITSDQVDKLAGWIFAKRLQLQKFDDLYAAAPVDLGEFKKADLLSAFRLVYATKAHRPPITGWPLRSPYSERAHEEGLTKNK